MGRQRRDCCGMRALISALAVFGLTACDSAPLTDASDLERPDPLRSGSSFLTQETRALQDDDFANPGFLWVDKGEALFHDQSLTEAACSSCHGESGGGLVSAAASFPKWKDGRLLNLEAQINACRTEHQDLPELAYESEGLLGLTAYVAHLSRGHPLKVDLVPEADLAFDIGKTYFHTKRGQFNLSCSQCHDENWGRQLRGDTISQGHGNGFPAYRLEWQTLGSLHRRFSDCDVGVRAEPKDLGSDIYIALEYYLAVRANGLELESPGVRR